MIPYLTPPVWQVGAFHIHAFGVMQALALVTAYGLVLKRSSWAGTSAATCGGIFVATVLSGLLSGYLFGGSGRVSGTGLAAGASLCLLTLAAFAGSFWKTLDVFAYATPVTLAISRVGCFLAHDHIGVRTGSWLAVRFPFGPSYDLGLLYGLAATAAAVIVGLLARTDPPPGTVTAVMLLTLAAGRFVVLQLGASRPSDYWFAAAVSVAGAFLLMVCMRRWTSGNSKRPV